MQMIYRILSIFLFLSLFLGGCQKKIRPIDENKQILRLNIHTEPPTMDTRKATDTSSIAIINMCFEGLMKRGKDGEIHPAVAHKVEISNNNTLYTFHLRPSTWWDGKPLTAHDFAKTWRTILDPAFPSGFANDLYVIKNGLAVKNGELPMDALGIKVIDNNTLQVQLERPIPYFLDLIASHCFYAVPQHITEHFPHWANQAGHLFVGNGPYKLIKWKHHNCIVLEKNQEYWDQELVILDKIHMSIVEDETTELNMFEAEELDWAGGPLSTLPTDALQSLAKQKRLETYPVAGTYYYIFNVNRPPFDNIHMRRAFALAIDRQIIIDNITQSDQAPATGFIPPAIWEVKPHFKDHDVEESRRLFDLGLVETGYTRKTLPTITLIYNSSSAHHKIAQAIQEQWFRAFGLRVRLANKDWKVFLDELSHKQFQIARMGGVAGFKDPLTFFDLYKYPTSSNNYSGWSNPAFTELIEKAEVTIDPKEREGYLRKAEDLFIAEMPIAPIYYYTGTFTKKKYVKGIHISDLQEADFKYAFLESQ
ncbi:MAG: Oligopeptide-binding protein OppA [Chlamydiae bacterium]|nr:Oligopeptide-binding protein OppA [Chlamydiota bacterium]